MFSLEHFFSSNFPFRLGTVGGGVNGLSKVSVTEGVKRVATDGGGGGATDGGSITEELIGVDEVFDACDVGGGCGEGRAAEETCVV